MESALTRRRVLVGGAIALGSVVLPSPIFAIGKLEKAVTRMAEKNYEDDIEDLDEDSEELEDLARCVSNTASQVSGSADPYFKKHLRNQWLGSAAGDGRKHTSKCPYCISVANEIESCSPVPLDSVPNRIPTCFIINGAQYYSGPWGALHRATTGMAEGFIVFQAGTYIGVDARTGQRIKAFPNC